MSLRRWVLAALDAIHPALFVVGIAVVLVQILLFGGAVTLAAFALPVGGPISFLSASIVVFVLTAPLAVGLYVPVRERTATVGESLRAAVDGIRRHYFEVLAATVAALAASVGIATVATAGSFVLATAVRYATYAMTDPGPPSAHFATWSFPLLFGGFLTVGALATRFADVWVAFGDGSARFGWRSSLAFVRREPVAFLGYVGVVAPLLGAGQVLLLAFDSVDDGTSVALGAGLVVLVGSVGLVLASALHVTYFERTVDPAVRSAPPRRPAWGRLFAVALVLLAAVAGAGYVRTADLGADQGEVRPLPDDPEAAYAVAATNTAESSHRYVVESRNESDPNATFRTVERYGVDYEDRQMYLYIHGEDLVLGGYFGEGTLATLNGGTTSAPRSTSDPLAHQSANWSVSAVPGYGLVAPSDHGDFEYDDVDWSIESTNESTVVYRVEAQDQILGSFSSKSYAGSTEPLADGSYLEVYVDREAAVVSGARFRLRSEETGNDFAYVARYEEVGAADLDRPDAIGPRTATEWIWDATYY